MRFLWRNAIFILFPAVVVAIIFLAMINVGTAVRFGEWGEKSMAESMMIVTNDKIERIEHVIRTTDITYFGAVSATQLDRACDRWRRVISDSPLVSSAFIFDKNKQIAAFFHREKFGPRVQQELRLIQEEILPLIDKYDSFEQYKHLHRQIGGEYVFLTHYTTHYEGQAYTTCLLYDSFAIEHHLLSSVLENVGEGRVANVVDDHNQPMFGRVISGAEEFIVARRFPSTLYKWRLQLAPTTAALFASQAQERAHLFSKALLIPLALAVIMLGLVVLYLSVVRERRLNRLKSEFVANVSHELKTPLSLIRMFGELLFLGKVDDPEKAKKYHEIILRETERLTALIENVLNLSRIERGKSAYEFTPSSMAEAVERGLEITRHTLEKAKIRLEYKISGELKPVRIDDRAITLAVVNLIDNAAKYAVGTKYVGVHLHQTVDLIILDVVDQGAGIPHGQKRRIFERFYRIRTKETQRQRGSGIGLSLVQHIVEGHGGTILVNSNPGVETRFSIRIPCGHESRQAK